MDSDNGCCIGLAFCIKHCEYLWDFLQKENNEEIFLGSDSHTGRVSERFVSGGMG